MALSKTERTSGSARSSHAGMIPITFGLDAEDSGVGRVVRGWGNAPDEVLLGSGAAMTRYARARSSRLLAIGPRTPVDVADAGVGSPDTRPCEVLSP